MILTLRTSLGQAKTLSLLKTLEWEQDFMLDHAGDMQRRNRTIVA